MPQDYVSRREMLALGAAGVTYLSASSAIKAAELQAMPLEITARKGFAALQRAKITSQSGTPFRISNFKGKPLLVNFWANWCPNCVGEFSSMQFVQNAITSHNIADFEVALVSQQKDWDKDQSFAETHQIPFPLYVHTWNNDNKIENADYRALACSYSVGGQSYDPMPLSYIIDVNGNLVVVLRGGVNWAGQQVMPYILKAIHPENPPIFWPNDGRI